MSAWSRKSRPQAPRPPRLRCAAHKMADDFFTRFAAIAVEGTNAAPTSGPKKAAFNIDLRWAIVVAGLMALSGWIGFIIGQGAHP